MSNREFNSELLKGIFPTLILKLLAHNDPMYGYDIERKIRILSDNQFIISEGSLYPILHKLEEKGFIKSSTKMVKNRLRKYYTVTKKGSTVAEEKANEVRSLYTSLTSFLLQFE